MSELFGVSRPALARVLSELKDEQIIDFENKEFKIVNLEKLKKIIIEG